MPDDRPPRSLVPGRYRTVAGARRARESRAKRLKPVLDALIESRDLAKDINDDPICFVHRYDDPLDQEVVGLVASSLAYGNVKVILKSVGRVLDVLGSRPARRITSPESDALDDGLAAFVHRWTRGQDVVALLRGAAPVIKEHGSIGEYFVRSFERAGSLRATVRTLSRAVVGEDPLRGLAFLLPDGTGGGACKRLHLYLRWMIRPSDGVDLGLWNVPPSALLMPLDTHTCRLCRALGLTHRKDASWRTSEEVTWNLRGLDPDDPVKYDFALSHLGISRDCMHRRDEGICGKCPLEGVCAEGR